MLLHSGLQNDFSGQRRLWMKAEAQRLERPDDLIHGRSLVGHHRRAAQGELEGSLHPLPRGAGDAGIEYLRRSVGHVDPPAHPRPTPAAPLASR